jgi:hypothetical protein
VSPTSEKDLARRRKRLIDAGMRTWYGSRINGTTLAELVAVMDAAWVLAASGDACREAILPEMEALKSRPPLNARDTGIGRSYLPDFWNGNWRRLRVRLFADADHRVGLYGRYQDLRACFLWCC